MKFTTPEDYATLTESINEIDKVSLVPRVVLTESNNAKFNLFESVGSYSVEVEIPKAKKLDLVALKSGLEAR
jgi:hypothetical protein